MKPSEDLKVPSFTGEYTGSTFTYASPKSGADSLDFLAQTIRGRDPNTCRIILICQQNFEAEHLKSELAGRDVNTILLAADDPMANQVLLLWSKGYIHQALILCDSMLNILEGLEVNFVIHTSLPPLKKFEQRLERLRKSEIKAESLVITAHYGGNGNSDNKIVKADTEMLQSPKNGVNESPKMLDKPQPLEDVPIKDIKPVVKVDPIYLRNLSEKEFERFKSSKDDEAKSVFNPTGAFSAIQDFNTPVVLEPIPKSLDDKEAQSSLKVEDIMKEFLKLTIGSKTPESQCDYKEDPSSFRVEGNVEEFGPSEEVSSSEASELELQSLLMSRRLQSALPELESSPEPPYPPQIVTIAEPLSLDLLDDTASLDSFQTVEDSPSPSISPDSLTAGGTIVYNYGILSWSRHLVVPCYDLSGVPGISHKIRVAMHQMGVARSRARAVQRFAWPHVAAGRSLIVVGNTQIGKTWCYLPILCQRSHEELQLRRPSDDHGPTSIVVCSNQSQGQQIGRSMDTLLRSLGNDSSLETMVSHWDMGNVTDILGRLSQPVGILLTSVDLLLQLLTHHSKRSPIFDAAAVKFIALDNLHDMVRLLPDVTMRLLKRLPEIFDFSPSKCQLFVSGRNWHPDLMRQRLLPLMPEVLLLFDDALEASVYGGVQLDTRIVPEEQKIEELVALIRQKNLSEDRTIVCCSSAAEVLHLRHQLDGMGIAVQTCISESCFNQVSQWRRQSPASLLLVADDVVPKLRCGFIALLIHFNWATSWMRFKHRFSLFHENYKSMPAKRCSKSVIFCQATDVDSIWLMADFLLKHGLPRPSHLLDILAQRRLAEPLHPMRLRLCRQVTAFGDCLRNSCRYRHLVWQQEVVPPYHYPTKGEIRFTVLTCNSPASLSVRLNDQYPTVAYFLRIPMTNLGQQVQRHYELEENRRRHPNPAPGERVVVKNMNRYERVVILEVNKEGNGNGKVSVQLMDTGTDILIYNASQVYICEKIFKDQPREAMEVRITGLEPESLDRIWPEDVRNVVRNQFFSRTQNRRCRQFSAVVQATIHETIFVRDVHDSEGNDLRTFVSSRFRVHQEEHCLDKLIRMVQGSKPRPAPKSH
ncbi:putative ATP-dependent RNA helicase SoYb [Drosophila takahashii]|uniref:putative ATP-dependent RNA helicase SoYb n=1 Tax=Drosophila takahashii TaxID=29030 RepID=UPI001CF8236D|nr:putative ATP-dependent RNA helicase SoYb [Drosophila takahashii]